MTLHVRLSVRVRAMRSVGTPTPFKKPKPSLLLKITKGKPPASVSAGGLPPDPLGLKPDT